MIHKFGKSILQSLWILILTFSYANCQSFEGENEVSSLFPKVKKNLKLQFPRDHGSHDDYRIEWWYLTANLTDQNQRVLGVQWTLFRAASEPNKNLQKWSRSQIWMGHAALTDKNSHKFHEKIARGDVLQAGVKTKPFEAWIDDWYLKGKDWQNLIMSAKGEDFEYFLKLEAKGPLVKHGDDGRSVKSSSGQASAYYSQPFFEAEGWVKKDGQKFNVIGSAWADHEWSSQFISKTQDGWDWFSLNFKTGEKLMLFQVRENNKKNFYSGTHIDANGNSRIIDSSQIQISPINSKFISDYPTTWQIQIQNLNIDVKIQAINPFSMMKTIYPYWEGPIVFSGSHSGNGYLEMTGYLNNRKN